MNGQKIENEQTFPQDRNSLAIYSPQTISIIGLLNAKEQVEKCTIQCFITYQTCIECAQADAIAHPSYPNLRYRSNLGIFNIHCKTEKKICS